MKSVNKCAPDNCIPTNTSCSNWNGGDIDYLGICNGDPLNNLVWELIAKLKEITEDDLSNYNIDSLLEICNSRAPNETSLLNILNVLRDNQICLKDLIDGLVETVSELLNINQVNVNLSCLGTQYVDNLGNQATLTPDQFNQILVNLACNHRDRLNSLDGTVLNLQVQIDAINNDNSITEPNISTCIDPIQKPTSSQVQSVASRVCNNEEAIGSVSDIASALSNTPSTDTERYGLTPNWIINPQDWSENYSNLLLKVANLEERIIFMEENCCKATCKDLELGFSVEMNGTNDGLILTFNTSTGTNIPTGFTDKGSHGTVTDIDGNSFVFSLNITDTYFIELPLTSVNTNGELTISITANMGTPSLNCQQCLFRVFRPAGCSYCTISNISSTGSVVIVYETVSDITPSLS